MATAQPPASGHNSVNNIAGDRLMSIVERVERLNEEKRALAEDIKDIFTEAKSAGFDPKVVREIIRIRQQDPVEREAREQLRDVYLRSIGMY